MVKIHIVDAPCGAGKTSGAINLMDSNITEKYIFITPFLNEVKRIKDNCQKRKFYEPQEQGTKLNGMHWLISNKKNIASTHALFLNFNDYTIDLVKQGEYTLILDEVANVVEIMDITKKDLTNILENYAHVEDGLLIWDDMDYEGKFSEVMRMSINRCVGIYGETALIWCFPIEIFKAFKEVYILTYMFNAQIQRYYYDFYNVQYDYLFVRKIMNNYIFTKETQHYSNLTNIKDKINVCDYEKLNLIGDSDTALSVSWFIRDKFKSNRPMINILKKNLYNYFKNVLKSSSDANMWTTFKDYKKYLQGAGYSKGFISVNARATNEYKNKTCLAYCANIFINPILKQFFEQKNIKVDEEIYALSELIQWIWRSAIRDGDDINIYIPSSRMRELLIEWLNSFNKNNIL